MLGCSQERLNKLMQSLHAKICNPVERGVLTTSGAALKTHNERLRSIEALGQMHPHMVTRFLLRYMETAQV